MAVAYKTPGVYIEEIPKFPPSVAAVETAIPAFIGYTELDTNLVAHDLNLKPTRISSLLEYEKYFGNPQPEGHISVSLNYTADSSTGPKTFVSSAASLTESQRSKHIMYYAMQMFFANGGGPCYVVSVGLYKSLGTALAESELVAGLNTLVKENEPTLIVIPEAQSLPIAGFLSLQNAALQQCADLQNRFVIMDAHGGDTQSMSASTTDLLDAIGFFRGKNDSSNNFVQGIGNNNLKYGAAYAPNIKTVLNFKYDEAQTAITRYTNGTALTGDPVMLNTIKDGDKQDNQSYELAKSAIQDFPNTLPPSAAMAGVYASVDNSRGVWKAPANVGLNTVIQPAIQVSDADQGEMNVDSVGGKSVNIIRSFLGRGTLVWGARTLAGNDNEWRYVNVRRLFIMVEQSVKNATAQFVFESNDANTWVKIQAMIENFLTTLWRQGALQGVKPEHAFYVSVGLGKTMTALDILEGRLMVEIGMAAVRPAEFIVLRFSHKMAES